MQVRRPAGGDDLAAIGLDDRERTVICDDLSQDRGEACLMDGNEGSALRIAVRIGNCGDGRRCDQPTRRLVALGK
jgi:hypothetical protein